MIRLVQALAHEIFHRTQPYGNVGTTQYEEFSAYYLSTHISGVTWMNIEAYDPFTPACMKRWFSERNLLQLYEGLEPYPQSVAFPSDELAQDCILDGDLTSHSALQADLTSQPDLDYTLECQADSLG